MISFDETLKMIERRRSVFPKSYERGEVEDEEIIKLLDVAKWAPTHKNTQPWFFVVFQGESKKALVEMQVEILKSSKGETPEVLDKADKMLEKADKTAAIIAVIMKRDLQKRVPQFEEEWAVACAVQNMHNLAPSLNLGCYWSTGASTNHAEMRNYLNLNEDDRHMGWFFVGRYSGESPLMRERNSWENYTLWKR